MSPTPHYDILSAWALMWSVWGALALRNKRVETTAGRRFMSIHMLLMVSAFVLVLSRQKLLPWRLLPDLAAIEWTGAALVMLGVSLALWARLYLGTNWSGTPTIKIDHELVLTGPYALTRHPIYTGIWFGVLGSAIAAGTVQGLAGIALMTVAYARKIPVEERLLRQHFGAAWDVYARRVPALVPFAI